MTDHHGVLQALVYLHSICDAERLSTASLLERVDARRPVLSPSGRELVGEPQPADGIATLMS